MNDGAREANEQAWRRNVLAELRAIRKLLEATQQPVVTNQFFEGPSVMPERFGGTSAPASGGR